MSRRCCSIGLVVLLALSGRVSAEAGQAGAVILPEDSQGRRHTVWLNSGEEVTGRLLLLRPSELRLDVEGRERNLPLADIARIDRIGDSLRNGAIVGALVAGVWCALVCGQGLDSSGQLPGVVAVNAGVGALIGIGIDAAHQKRTTVYRRPAATGGHQAKGVVVLRLRF